MTLKYINELANGLEDYSDRAKKLTSAGFSFRETNLTGDMYVISDESKTWVLEAGIYPDTPLIYLILWCNDTEKEIGHLPIETVLILAGALFPQKKGQTPPLALER